MSGEKQKVSPLTEPALPSFQFSIFNSQFNKNVLRRIRKPILGRDDKSAVHWVKKSIWMSTTLWR